MTEKVIYRTRFIVEVLSDEPYEFSDLKDVAHDIYEGDCSGVMFDIGQRVVQLTGEINIPRNREEAQEDCDFHGTDLTFFQVFAEEDDA